MLTALLLTPTSCRDIGESRRFQEEAMNRFITPSTQSDIREQTIRHFCGAQIHIENVCSWNGVKCTADAVTSLSVLPEPSIQHITVALDWLPPKLEYVHLKDVFLYDGWLADRLPRKTKYLYMGNVGTFKETQDRCVDLQRLPAEMEELILQDSWYRGKIVLTGLPQNMRILWLQHIPCDKAFLDPDLLPSTLVFICIRNSIRGADLRGMNMKYVGYHMNPASDANKMLVASKTYACMEYIGRRHKWVHA